MTLKEIYDSKKDKLKYTTVWVHTKDNKEYELFSNVRNYTRDEIILDMHLYGKCHVKSFTEDTKNSILKVIIYRKF